MLRSVERVPVELDLLAGLDHQAGEEVEKLPRVDCGGQRPRGPVVPVAEELPHESAVRA
jgi:hypothetical protein